MAIEAGLTPAAIRHRIDSGRWRPVAGRAYVDTGRSVPRWVTPVLQRAVGATMLWPTAIVCLRTAALLHELPVPDDDLVHLSVGPGRRAPRGVAGYSFEIPPRDVRRTAGFCLTAPRRTLLDCLSRLPYDEAERLMAWVRTRDLLTDTQLQAAIEERANTWGVPQLRSLVAATAHGALSELERRLHQLLHEAGITGWTANRQIVVDGSVIARADVLFQAEKLVVEADGRAYHDDFEHERERLNRLSLAGYTVLRFTWKQVTGRPGEVVDQIRMALGRQT
ncbi:type IV toxin-antitoxin system AbiEi family antitoxin domain-containing protein [Georgenia halophila]|uniref:Type IV toxin-antitoxin system AbiEi family antitoxin domain-containing protein n=2 Tax=Georgenia halophila TaxID=620889 RepID=A0ABP8LGC2_9MICO